MTVSPPAVEPDDGVTAATAVRLVSEKSTPTEVCSGRTVTVLAAEAV